MSIQCLLIQKLKHFHPKSVQFNQEDTLLWIIILPLSPHLPFSLSLFTSKLNQLAAGVLLLLTSSILPRSLWANHLKVARFLNLFLSALLALFSVYLCNPSPPHSLPVLIRSAFLRSFTIAIRILLYPHPNTGPSLALHPPAQSRSTPSISSTTSWHHHQCLDSTREYSRCLHNQSSLYIKLSLDGV